MADRLIGPDGLHVEVVPTKGSYGVWARQRGVYRPAVLLVTRRGAIVGIVPDPDRLARMMDVADLHAA